MTTSIVEETPRPLAAVSREHPATKNVSPKTVGRWAQRGVRGVKLESIQIGGRLMTTTAALNRFLAALNSAPTSGTSTTPAPRSPTARQKASAAAAAELEKLGA